ncbi:MAG: hypothetical protein JRN51_06495, partial [Nitrososphaerota archaeon]|nr:hypothetical protein [Nitrososphaerota archaeon]
MDSFASHKVKLDSSGRLKPWLGPESRAYDRVMKLAWDFIRKVPVEDNGLRSYLSYPTFSSDPPHRGKAWPHNPAGLYSMFVDSLVRYYPYSAEEDLVGLVGEMLDYTLAHGLTPKDWVWAGVPFASSDSGAREYQGADEAAYTIKPPPRNYIHELRPGTGDGIGVIEPDKVSEFGRALVQYYSVTDKREYLEAAERMADALLKNVRPSSYDRPPWPFRAFGWNGKPREEYTSNMVAHLKFFDELTKVSHSKRYGKAKKEAWSWLVSYPLKSNKWKGYFEDIMLDPMNQNREQYSALETARYLLEQREALDADWKEHAKKILDWVELTFGEERWGAVFVNEQLWSFCPMPSHTARFASVCAMWYEATGDKSYREKALRSLNASTYFVGADGMVDTFPQQIVDGDETITRPGDPWFSDGYADYIRNVAATIGAIPELAPSGEDHLLRSTSVVKRISYASQKVEYETCDLEAREVLSLSFKPA